MKHKYPLRNLRQEALKYEAKRDLVAALDAWQSALLAEPEAVDIAAHIARLAFSLGDWETAEKLYAHLITHGQKDAVTLGNYAACLMEQLRYDEAIDFLKSALGQYPDMAKLWETLGCVLVVKNDIDTALTFFDEALRLEPRSVHALFNHGCALMDKGELKAGLKEVIECARKFKDPTNRASAEIIAAYASLLLGDLTAGWRWYEGRHKKGTLHEVNYQLKIPRLSKATLSKGSRIFISAEQGLGDEILFGSLLPDLWRDIGPDGTLGIGVEPRLVALFQRSFPHAIVASHRTQTVDGRLRRSFPELDEQRFDHWALMGDFLASKRGQISDFPPRQDFLRPDPDRVAYWKGYFNKLDGKPKVGLLWKSLKSTALRDRDFSPFQQWKEVLGLTDYTFVNLQYGDSRAELAEAEAEGYSIVTPDGIDLKQDLDELAALCSALNIVLGPSNATTNISAACGVNTWMLLTPGAWARLGQDHYPWYPSVRLFSPPTIGDWPAVMKDICKALTDEKIEG